MKDFLLGCLLLISGPAWCQVVEPTPTSEDGYDTVELQYDDGARGAASGDDPAVILNGISVATSNYQAAPIFAWVVRCISGPTGCWELAPTFR